MGMPSQFPILLIDDDPNVADILIRAGEQAFPEAIFMHVSSFAEAATYLDDLTGRGPRLILLDIDLQTGPNGFEFLSLIRGHAQGSLLPVIILSSSQEERDTWEAYQRGATAYTQKPFDYKEWKTYIKQIRSYWYETVTLPQLWFNKEA
ncbi:response regulator [Spirosoma knui]